MQEIIQTHLSLGQLETRYVGGRFLYRLKGQAVWHYNAGDAHAILQRTNPRPLV